MYQFVESWSKRCIGDTSTHALRKEISNRMHRPCAFLEGRVWFGLMRWPDPPYYGGDGSRPYHNPPTSINGTEAATFDEDDILL
jgi:hypothetical protein